MLNKTALALSVGVALYFLPHVNSKEIFIPVVILSGFIPQLGTLKKNKIKENSFIEKLLKNYIACVLGAIILAFSYPVFALPFFIGYSFNLTLNAFSKDGIQPFWPLTKKKTSGSIVSEGKVDNTIFYVLIIVDIALLIKIFL